jgi:hypothetical protein
MICPCTSQRATSCCLYKHRSRSIDISRTIEQTHFTFISIFKLVFYFFFFSYIRSSIHHFNPLGCHGSHLSSIQMSLGRWRNSLGPFGSPNRTVRFLQFWSGASGSCLICLATHFGGSAGELTTSSTSGMKGGNSNINGSNLDKGNILKPTIDTLMDEGCKAFEAYSTNLQELFLSRCEVTWHGIVLKDTMLIIFNKLEVIPEVRPDPSPSCNDIQSLINSALERQAKSIDELLRRLIEERDGKNFDATSVNPSSTSTISFTQTNPYTRGALTVGTSMPNPSAQPVNHFHS